LFLSKIVQSSSEGFLKRGLERRTFCMKIEIDGKILVTSY